MLPVSELPVPVSFRSLLLGPAPLASWLSLLFGVDTAVFVDLGDWDSWVCGPVSAWVLVDSLRRVA